MGSTIRVNDTLQITPEQGFPTELDIHRHLESPFSYRQFKNRVFSFRGKEGVRTFQQPPVQNFLVENRGGKHIYWGLITMLTVTHDYLDEVTSGRYQIHTLYTPEQMRMAARMTGIASELDYFANTDL
ncbi:MAG: hypothetical protein M3511_07735 [Deinococcota bacterium]|jgi:hypothetical protein|nr:hypothetical protein [Deinococcota bacterium]